MKLFCILLLAGSGVARADSQSDAAAIVSSLATSLSGDNVVGFLRSIDKETPGYAQVRSQVETLIARAQVSSSISILENDGDDVRRALLLDWYVEIRSREIGDKTEPRRKTVRCVVAKQAKVWRIAELALDGLLE